MERRCGEDEEKEGGVMAMRIVKVMGAGHGLFVGDGVRLRGSEC